MHGPIRDRLEGLLGANDPAAKPRELSAHLAACGECSAELEAMRRLSRALTQFRAPAETEPSPGFYQRVIQQIEEQRIVPFWSIFMDRTFSKRLAIASVTLAMALGSYVASEDVTRQAPAAKMVALENHYDATVTGSREEQRDAVLVNFATHHLLQAQGQIQ